MVQATSSCVDLCYLIRQCNSLPGNMLSTTLQPTIIMMTAAYTTRLQPTFGVFNHHTLTCDMGTIMAVSLVSSSLSAALALCVAAVAAVIQGSDLMHLVLVRPRLVCNKPFIPGLAFSM